jgi:hypothetical protein
MRMAPILPHTWLHDANKLVKVIMILDVPRADLAASRWVTWLCRICLNSVASKLVYTSRARSRIMHPTLDSWFLAGCLVDATK